METAVATITLNRMQFFARHGVGEQERVVGNRFEVTLSVRCDVAGAVAADALEGTVDYSALYAVVEREMAIPSALLEHVAGRIAAAVKREFARVLSGEVTVTKLTPPFKCQLAGVSVTLAF